VTTDGRHPRLLNRPDPHASQFDNLATRHPQSCVMAEERDNQLPACQKCKLRKVKCDRQAPKCTPCTKGNVACIIVDRITGEQYARDYIHRLEEKERHLRQRLLATGNEVATTEMSDAAERTPTGPATVASTGSQAGFVGDGSGLGFLQNILSDSKWQHHRAQILGQLANRPRIVERHFAPNALPPAEETQELLDSYFVRFHFPMRFCFAATCWMSTIAYMFRPLHQLDRRLKTIIAS
jgi:hypothetical protein